jgi:hypothetical protein
MKHKTEDYKLSAVKYYLSNRFSLDYVMYVIFLVVKKQSLTRWVKIYNEVKELKHIIEPTYHINNKNVS